MTNSLKQDIQAVADGKINSVEQEQIALTAALEHLSSAELSTIAAGLGKKTFADERLERTAARFERDETANQKDGGAEQSRVDALRAAHPELSQAIDRAELGQLKPSPVHGQGDAVERGGRE
jgi:hypothetical protein